MNYDKKSDLVFEPSTIENVDLAMYHWLNETMNLYAETNRGWNKTPVIWVNGERSWQIKNNKDLRNSNNNFILPVMTIERTDITKDKDKKGKYWADIRPFNDEKGGSIAIHKVINQDKTSNFANADSKKAVGQPNFKRENKKVVYQTKQDIQPTLEYVKQLSEHTPGEDFRHVAEVPMVIYQKAIREGWAQDSAQWKKWLNHSDNKPFRTWKGKV